MRIQSPMLFTLLFAAICDHVSSKKALLVIDMQNDFISGSLAVTGGADIVPAIDSLMKKNWSFRAMTQDYHPASHISFAANSPNRLNVFSKVNISYDFEGKVCGAEYNPLYGDKSSLCVKQCKPFCDRMGVIAGTFEQTLWPTHCVQETTGAAFHPDLASHASKVVVIKKGLNPVVDSYSAIYNVIGGDSTGLDARLKKEGITDVYLVGLALDYCVKYTALDLADLKYNTFVITDATKPVSSITGEDAIKQMNSRGVKMVTIDDAEKAVNLNENGDNSPGFLV